MIDQALQFIVGQLNRKFSSSGKEPLVSLPKEEPGDTVKLVNTAVTALLVRMEEERVMRQDEPYMRFSNGDKTKDRKAMNAFPPVVLHLFVLFVARFPNYGTGLKHISDIITFFQARPFFHDNTSNVPAEMLPAGLPELRLELHSPTFTVQNEIWGALRLPLHPSVMYKVTLVLLEAQEEEQEAPMVKNIEPARHKGPNESTLTNESPIYPSIVNHPS